jgi:hypothetical protein
VSSIPLIGTGRADRLARVEAGFVEDLDTASLARNEAGERMARQEAGRTGGSTTAWWLASRPRSRSAARSRSTRFEIYLLEQALGHEVEQLGPLSRTSVDRHRVTPSALASGRSSAPRGPPVREPEGGVDHTLLVSPIWALTLPRTVVSLRRTPRLRRTLNTHGGMMSGSGAEARMIAGRGALRTAAALTCCWVWRLAWGAAGARVLRPER